MRRFSAIFAATLAGSLLAASAASAEFGFKELDFGLTGSQAGAHPAEVTTTLQMNTVLDEAEEFELPDGQLRNLEVDLPAGFAGNPTAVPRCSDADFTTTADAYSACPNETVVGLVAAKAEFEPLDPATPAYYHLPLLNLEPEPGFAAKLGFVVIGVPVTIDVGLREAAPFGVYARITNISESAVLYGSKVTLWGVPASPSHDALRGTCLEAFAASEIDEPISKGSCAANAPEAPFLTSPRSCDEPLTVSLRGVAWNTGDVATGTTSAPARDGCGEVGFAPEATAQLTSTQADSPSGLSFELNIEDEALNDPSEGAIALSDIKRAEVVLPEGISFNPSQAQGLAACSEAQLAQETAGSEFGDGCPAASMVGSVEAETPLLENKVLKGSLFVAQPYQNPFGSLIALYMVIKDRELGISVKLPARVYTDPVTGQVRTTFGDPSAKDPALRTLPQVPLSHVRVSLPGGPRSPLATPPTCGSYEGKAVFTPWANPEEPSTSSLSFEIGSGPAGSPCPPAIQPFAPGFLAGSMQPSAGAFSTFSMRLTRNETEQELTRFSATLPQGLIAKIAGIPECSEAAIAAARSRSGTEELLSPSCPAASRVGEVLGGAGVGPELTYVPGSLYLAGPFAGHPLSIVSIVPAVAGPFDLGTVVVREALDLNPLTAQAEVDGSSDTIPRILQGIPLQLRDLRIHVDRPEFTLNPTSCAEKQILANAVGESLQANLMQSYQVANCAALRFKPKLSLELSGQLNRSGNPAVRSVLIPRAGDANIGGAIVTLPKSEFIDNSHINNPCTRVQFAANECPPNSILGTARATTPLLDAPLAGPVYFRSNGGERELPDLVADLHGQFHIILVGFIDSKGGRVRTRFLNVPDAPVSRFELSLFGGKRGLLENTRNLCKGERPHVKLSLLGQNGRRSETTPKLGASCKGKKRAK